jgi:hypothetical protein
VLGGVEQLLAGEQRFFPRLADHDTSSPMRRRVQPCEHRAGVAMTLRAKRGRQWVLTIPLFKKIL